MVVMVGLLSWMPSSDSEELEEADEEKEEMDEEEKKV